MGYAALLLHGIADYESEHSSQIAYLTCWLTMSFIWRLDYKIVYI